MKRPFALFLAVLAAIAWWLTSPPSSDEAKLSSIQAPPPAAPSSGDLLALSRQLWPKLGGQGSVSRDDLDRAVLDQTISGDEALALWIVRQNFADLAKPQAFDLKLEDLERFHSQPPPAVKSRIDDQMKHGWNFLRRVNRSLYPQGPDSLERMRSTHQLNRGNCYLVSGITSQAAIGPDRIQSMIVDNGKDKRGVRSYTVTFPYAPDEPLTVEEFTDAALLSNDVTEDSGTWLAVLTRAYGLYQEKHPYVRWQQRWFYRLNSRALPEDVTDHGSMNSDGLRLMSDRAGTRVKQVVWSLDAALVEDFLGSAIVDLLNRYVRDVELVEDNPLRELFGPVVPDLVQMLKQVDDGFIKKQLAKTLADLLDRYVYRLFVQPRDIEKAHAQLKHSLADNKLPATVFKYGGAHEASIIDYTPGTVSKDGKRKSAYGFITVRDQAGLSAEETEKLQKGVFWRAPGADDKTVTMTLEEFVRFTQYNGFASVIKR